jgi:hypothetical protein
MIINKMKNETYSNKLNEHLNIKQKNNHNSIENKTSYSFLSLSYKPMNFSKSASQQNIYPKNKIILNKKLPGYLHLKEFESSQYLKNSCSNMRNSNQSNKFSKSYHSFAMSSRNSSLLTNISIMINPNSNELFNTFKQNNNNSNAVINRKSILPYLYRNLHEKKLNGKNNKEIYKTYLKLLQQKFNSNDFIQKNSINKNQSEELFLKNIYFNNRNDYNFISNKMRVKFNKYNILKKNKNKLNIKYSLNKNVDGNCLKKNNSELSLALRLSISLLIESG